MKRLNIIALALLVSASSAFAGGLVTNTNQSAAWARTLTRDASINIDAVYYNPAGLAKLKNGLSLSLSNQTVFQTRTIVSDYPFLTDSPKTYQADLTAPIFPSVYAAYKFEKWAFSAGFNVIGGGGSAEFKQGIPSLEIPVSNLVPGLQNSLSFLDEGFAGVGMPAPSNVTGYGMNASFSGSSIMYGIQVGATYAINDIISVALGGRYVMATNTYEGSMTDITVDAPDAYGGTQAPGDYATTLSAIVTPISAPGGAMLDEAAAGLYAQTADQFLETTQKGNGFTPIIGVNINLGERINIGARYEHHTKIELTNDTPQDIEPEENAMFPDGEVSRSDLPGMFAVGVTVKPLEKLAVNLSMNYFLDKGAFYGNTDANGEQIDNESTIDDNGLTLAASLEYKFLGILGVSAGYSYSNLGVNENYQTDMSYANSSSTIAGGVFVDIGEMIRINAGYMYVMYNDYLKNNEGPPAWTDTYGKKTNIFALGIDFTF